MTETALEVIHPATGEIIDVRQAETEDLARVAGEDLPELRDQLADVETAISDELVRRLDRAGQWTQRVGHADGAAQYEIKAPSPTAGTTAYDETLLRERLLELLDLDAIAEELAGAALECTVTIVAKVPVAADLDDLKATLEGIDAIAGTTVRDVKVTTSQTARAAGVSRLAKAGFAGIAGEVSRHVPAGHRKAKVTLRRRER